MKQHNNSNSSIHQPSNKKNGWPWVLKDKEINFTNTSSLPRISIITPSYNQSKFLEETILSVLGQGYPNLEYIVMDGGSTDGSKEIIEKYASQLTYWRSEPDEGQSAAIREGFERATGDILGWLNSDDILLPDALFEVGHFFSLHPESECVNGGSIVIDETGQITQDRMRLPRILRGGRRNFKHLLLVDCGFFQPASFWRQDVYVEIGGLDPQFIFTMDYDLYLRLAKRKPLDHLDKLLACFRFHTESKTTRLEDVRYRESQKLWLRYKRNETSRIYRFLYKMSKIVLGRFYNFPIRLGVKFGIVRLPY